jgi:manganese/zinc/iron transport system permease protein
MPADSLLTLLQDPAVRTVAGGAGLLGAVAGSAGAFAVVRRNGLQGDVVSHAALPGVAAAALFGGDSPGWLIFGGAVAGWLSLLAVAAITRHTKTTVDSALAIALATFFGMGLVLKSIVQRRNPGAETVGLDQYLFGQSATMRSSDVAAIALVGGVLLVVGLATWHRLKVVSFDAAFAGTLGIRSIWYDRLLTTAVVAAAVVGLQAVGVVLMSALLVAPAVAARCWSDRLGLVVGLSAAIGAASGVVGTLLTATTSHVPTGPVIVLVATAIVVASFAGRSLRRLISTPTRRIAPAGMSG